MSNYTKATNFASKDSLLTGNPLKIVKGTEIDNEFNAIATAVGTKFDTAALASPGPIGATTPAAISGTTISGTTGTFSGDVQMASQNGGQLAGLRNRIINGGMQILQRSLPSVTGAIQFGADRWQGVVNGGTGISGSFVRSPSTSYASGYYFGFGSASWTNGIVQFFQRIEANNVQDLSGKTITVSLRVFQDTGTARSFVIQMYKPNAKDNWTGQTFIESISAGSVASGSVTPIFATFTLGATDAVNGLGVYIIDSASNTVASKNYFIGDVQLEVGPVATPFEQRPYGMELALCQRYYEETAFDIPVSGNTAVGMWAVEKRATPTLSNVYSVGSGGSVATDPNAPRKAIRAGSYATVSASVKVIGVSEL